MRGFCRAVLAVLYWAEDQFAWLFNYAIFPLQILVILLAAWGVLGAELGVERLFWSEDVLVQFGSGAAVGMLFGVVLFVWYLLDRPLRALRWVARPGWPTLFPSADPAIRAVGAYLIWALPLLLGLLLGGKLAAFTLGGSERNGPTLRDHLASRHYLLWGILGYAATLGLGWLLFVLDERLGLRNTIARSALFRRLGGVVRGRIPPQDVTLHATTVYLVLVGCLLLMLALAALVLVHESHPGQVITSPVLLVCLVFILLSLLYGYWSFHIHLGTLTLVVILVLLFVWNSATIFPEVEYKLQIPGLEDYYEPTQRIKLEDLQDGWVEKGRELLPRPLLEEEAILAAIRQRWQARHGNGSKPKIVIIAASGGGVRAAVWTARVLEGLREAMPGGDGVDFREHVRLVTGASGGMLAAALMVADWEDDWPDRGQPQPTAADRHLGLGLYSGILAEQSLLPTFQTAVLRDFSSHLFVPPWRSVAWDRGRTLEEKWMLNARARGFGPPGQRRSELEHFRQQNRRLSPFQRTFADLYPLEAQGRRPSLILAPMLVEDSRRLLISNLDLRQLAVAGGRLGPNGHNGPPLEEQPLSRSGLECFKLFPLAMSRLEVGTAARLNATFPVISPAVSLPTLPPRHVVDAGYFDNYGVDLAVMWLVANREAVLRHCGGVALVEIRAFPLQHRGLDLGREAPAQPEAAGLIADTLAALSAPLRAVLRARGNVGYHRNNELLAVAQQLFPLDPTTRSPYWRRFVLELDTEAALSWYISDEEKRRISEAFLSEPVQQQVQALVRWLGDGGAP
ncbi:MAG: hypothetical protein WHU94_09810 [Thermogemmata sp.]